MIKIIKGSKTPLEDIGEVAGICWKSPIEKEKNIKRALECIENNHGRVLEYTDLTMYISEYSARAIRELYTHIIGTSRLQESTRYVNCNNFKYYTPPTIKNENKEIYDNLMKEITKVYSKLIENGVPKEYVANVLPLGMNTAIVLKINLRALQHLMNTRLCSRAYKEMRQLTQDIKKTISDYSEQWKIISDKIFVVNCEANGFCSEKYTCGKYPTKTDIMKLIKENYKVKQ